MDTHEKEKALDTLSKISDEVGSINSVGKAFTLQNKLIDFLESLWQAGYKKGFSKGVKEGKESLVKGHILN